MTRSKRKPIQNELVRNLALLADEGRTASLDKAWDIIVERDRTDIEARGGKAPRFVRRQQGKWRQQRKAEDRKLKRELVKRGAFS